MSELPSFVLAALALAGSPGPNTLSLAAVGAAFGRLRGMRYMAGLTLGMVFVIAIVGSGVSGVLLALPGAAQVITLIAAAYFAYLAYRIASQPRRRSNRRRMRELRRNGSRARFCRSSTRRPTPQWRRCSRASCSSPATASATAWPRRAC